MPILQSDCEGRRASSCCERQPTVPTSTLRQIPVTRWVTVCLKGTSSDSLCIYWCIHSTKSLVEDDEGEDVLTQLLLPCLQNGCSLSFSFFYPADKLNFVHLPFFLLNFLPGHHWVTALPARGRLNWSEKVLEAGAGLKLMGFLHRWANYLTGGPQ